MKLGGRGVVCGIEIIIYLEIHRFEYEIPGGL